MFEGAACPVTKRLALSRAGMECRKSESVKGRLPEPDEARMHALGRRTRSRGPASGSLAAPSRQPTGQARIEISSEEHWRVRSNRYRSRVMRQTSLLGLLPTRNIIGSNHTAAGA
ncbi:hypothetical protein MGN01_04250 [Methylobacterium gnaphalii]|uniref:Uncharacterized protein n=1 Tax=Methylobacterium gnaphalii TaxID=1010610 RepID=A0A512JF55_9HYPH|nr:hypothetical protein MGN01_04250 [Methylobacterium gnaphalii]GLS50797.1 hypothetical protein GCM10007885_36510 [Methylobacterium gnaphalii]